MSAAVSSILFAGQVKQISFVSYFEAGTCNYFSFQLIYLFIYYSIANFKAHKEVKTFFFTKTNYFEVS